jgi:hypothetical protein
MSKKSRATASSLPMMAQCPCYESDRSTVSPFAEFGTLFHKAVEERDDSILFTDEALILAREAGGKTRSAIESAYTWAVEYIEKLENDYSPCNMIEELKGQCSLLPGRNFYIDLFILTEDGKRASVVDWKTSRNLDDYQADSCEQGLLYAAACFELSPDIEEVDVVFAATFAEEDSFFTFTRETDSEWLINTIQPIVSEADNPDAEPQCMSKCTWCSKYKTCPETTSVVAVAMENRFGEVLVRAQQSPDLMAKLRDTVPVLDQVVKDIKKAANDMWFEEGKEIPGYFICNTSGKSTVKDAPSILKKLIADYDLDIEDFVDYIKLDMKAIEVIVRNSVPRGQGAKSYDQFVDTCRASGWVKGGDGPGAPYLRKSKKKTNKRIS